MHLMQCTGRTIHAKRLHVTYLEPELKGTTHSHSLLGKKYWHLRFHTIKA